MRANGVNLDPANPAGAPTPQEVVAAGFQWVRIVSREGYDGYIAGMKFHGIKVLAIVAAESEGYVVPGATLYQIGNEPDIKSDSSWTMTPDDYLRLWFAFKLKHPQKPAITAGLASGTLDWWLEVAPQITGAHGFAVHPYAKEAPAARQLLRSLKLVRPDLPCYVTEWNRPISQVAEFAAMLQQETAASMWFAWSDGMVPGFGLTDTHKSLFRQMAPKETPMSLDVSQPMIDKLKAAGDKPILDSTWRTNKDGSGCEVTQGTKGLYISSEADAWTLRGPFVPAL